MNDYINIIYNEEKVNFTQYPYRFIKYIVQRFKLNSNSKYRLKIDHRISKSSNSVYPKLGIHFSEDSISNYYASSIDNPYFTRFVPPIKEYINR